MSREMETLLHRHDHSPEKAEKEEIHIVQIPSGNSIPEFKSSTPVETETSLPKLLFGAGGIYAAYLYYGSLQEDVFSYTHKTTNEKFSYAWYLQTLEALTNIFVGFIGMKLTQPPNVKDPKRQSSIPKLYFFYSGTSQVCSKAFTGLSLAHGLSFPVATLAKSGKMAPVMCGQFILGGDRYSLREYLQVGLIIGGTSMLSLSKSSNKNGNQTSTTTGLLFILFSLAMDGVTAGVQKRLKNRMEVVGFKPTSYEFLFWTNLYMFAVALLISVVTGDFMQGWKFCLDPEIWLMILKFCVCSAVGQSFIFYVVANFDPLVCSTVTTTRKIVSVLLSIVTRGYVISLQGWLGVAMACGGILAEVHGKCIRGQSTERKRLC